MKSAPVWMRTPLGLCTALLVGAAAGLAAQEAQVSSEPMPEELHEEAVHLYAEAVKAMLGRPGTAYVAARLRGAGTRLMRSELPERVVESLAGDGYGLEVAELAENGLWQFPRGGLFLMLEEIQWWPGRKIAVLNIHVGNSSTELREVGFTFRREGESWRLIEKGPAEN